MAKKSINRDLRKISLSQFGPLNYNVSYLSPFYGSPKEGIAISALEIDGHYVLDMNHECGKLNEEPRMVYTTVFHEVFGISHTPEEADERLYTKAKESAEAMAKRLRITNLEDLTRHFQRLPRGGK